MNKSIINKLKSILLISTILLFLKCNKPVDTSPMVAQVGNTPLTLIEIQKQLGKNGSELISTDYLQSYVYRWIDNELIYQSAISKGFDKLPFIQEGLQKLKRDLVISYYIEDKMSNLPPISEEDIAEYYQENQASFQRDYVEFRYYYLICKDRQTAQTVKAALTKGEAIENIVQKNYPENIFNNQWDSGYIPIENVILSLQRSIARQQTGSYIGPVAGEGGHILYQLVEKHERGSFRDIELVKNQIIQRLRERRYRERFKELMVSLKSNKKIELNLATLEKEVVPDTTVKKLEGSL